MEWLPLLLLILVKCSCTGATFSDTPQETELCAGTNSNLTWAFSNAGAQLLVQWTFNVTTTVARLLGGTTFVPGTGYAGRLQNDGNGGLVITSVTPADSGNYKCVVSYSDTTPQAESEITLSVYSLWTVTLEVTEKQDDKSETTLHSNINDSTVQHTWNSKAGGSSLAVTKNGDYTLCISGGRAECLSPASSNCVTYTVKSIESTTAMPSTTTPTNITTTGPPKTENTVYFIIGGVIAVIVLIIVIVIVVKKCRKGEKKVKMENTEQEGKSQFSNIPMSVDVKENSENTPKKELKIEETEQKGYSKYERKL